MYVRRVKCLLVAVFSVFCLVSNAQHHDDENGHQAPAEGTENHKEEKKFDANEVIFGHVLDGHQYHWLTYKGSDGKDHHVGLSLPVILYSSERGGLKIFSSSAFDHGHKEHEGYRVMTDHYREEIIHKGYDAEKAKAINNETIIAVDENDMPAEGVKVYDLSITRNVVQMLLAMILLTWLLISVAKAYARNGATKAPKGMQNLMEVLITFIRDEVAKPNLGHKWRKYMPFLLTAFFFILINNVIGLIPGTANVTGNIAFTLVLGLISFIVILFSTNKHYWGHIFNPPVPMGVKPIMVPVEFLGIFTKPIALIVRLFANMIAGHIIIICLISLIFIFGNLSAAVGWIFSPISIAFTVFIYFIEILVAFLQAYIFTNLTAVFIGQAFEGSHDDVDQHHDPVIV